MKRVVLVLAASIALSLPSSRAALFSKTYVFEANTKLEVGAELPGGCRVDSVTLHVPEEPRLPPLAEVAISNLGTETVRVGIAMALVDRSGKLLAVASGGSKLFPLRPERQMTYRVAFDHVNGDAARASVFMLAVEPRR